MFNRRVTFLLFLMPCCWIVLASDFAYGQVITPVGGESSGITCVTESNGDSSLRLETKKGRQKQVSPKFATRVLRRRRKSLQRLEKLGKKVEKSLQRDSQDAIVEDALSRMKLKNLSLFNRLSLRFGIADSSSVLDRKARLLETLFKYRQAAEEIESQLLSVKAGTREAKECKDREFPSLATIALHYSVFSGLNEFDRPKTSISVIATVSKELLDPDKPWVCVDNPQSGTRDFRVFSEDVCEVFGGRGPLESCPEEVASDKFGAIVGGHVFENREPSAAEINEETETLRAIFGDQIAAFRTSTNQRCP